MSTITTIILTGGAATRMRPLSVDKSKTMISFMGKPLLLHLIRALKSYGLTDMVFTSPGRGDEIKKYFSDGKEYDVGIKYCDDEKWYGTAGIVKTVIDTMKDGVSDPFVVIYGDSLLRADFGKMVQFHFERDSWCTILYHRPNFESFLYEYHDKSLSERGKRTNYGLLDIDSEDRVIAVEEKPLIAAIKNYTDPVANAAVYLIKKEVLDFVSPDHPCDFPRDLFPLLIKNQVPCFGFYIGEEGYRIDIGITRHYYSTHFVILDGKIHFDHYFPFQEEKLWLGSGSTIDPAGSLEKPVLIGENSRIGSNTRIERSIIGSNVDIGENSLITSSIILDHAHIGNKVSISNSIVGENCSIDNGVSLPSNTVLGNHCHLGGTPLVMSDTDFFGLVRANNSG